MQQNATLPYPDADLREHPPRPAREMLGGVVFMPRTIDKARAKLQNTLGKYKILPGISGYLLEGLGLTEEAFLEAVKAAHSDADVMAWIDAHGDLSKVAELNEMLVNRGIRDAEHRAQVLPNYPVLKEHPELSNWFEIFDLDDRWMFDPANRGKEGSALSD